jgi:hypothetical protein
VDGLPFGGIFGLPVVCVVGARHALKPSPRASGFLRGAGKFIIEREAELRLTFLC